MRVKTNKKQPEPTASAVKASKNPMTIQQLRAKTGLSQEKFAKLFNLTAQSVRNWEQGIRQAPDYVTFMIQRVILLEEENAKLKKQNETLKNKIEKSGK